MRYEKSENKHHFKNNNANQQSSEKEKNAYVNPNDWENKNSIYNQTQLATFKMEINRSWREQKVMLKRRFSVLSDSDFEFKEGDRESMLKKTRHQTEKDS